MIYAIAKTKFYNGEKKKKKKYGNAKAEQK